MITITWLRMNSFTTVIPDMDSALHVEYSDAVPCGASVDINNYQMDGLATITNSMTLLRNLNYKQTHHMMLIWNGFHSIALMLRYMAYTYMVYLPLIIYLLNCLRLR